MQIKQTTRRVGIIKKCARKAKFHAYVSRSVVQRMNRLMYGGYDLPPSNRCEDLYYVKLNYKLNNDHDAALHLT